MTCQESAVCMALLREIFDDAYLAPPSGDDARVALRPDRCGATLTLRHPLTVDGLPRVLVQTLCLPDEAFDCLRDARLDHALYTDYLTGVYNRRYFDERLASLPGAIAMLDLDNFKQINDTYLHQAGDQALKEAARTISRCLASEDTLIRYGGDEFALIFADPSPARFLDALDRIRAGIAALRIPQCPDVSLTVSIGGSCLPDEPQTMLRRADALLYEAKKQKNCIRTDVKKSGGQPDA